MLGTKELKWVNNVKYLGNMLNESLDDTTDVVYKRGLFIQSVNYLLHNFSCLQTNVICRLFESYCTSYYGCHLWDLESKNCELMLTAWNKAVHRIWNLPVNTHRVLLPHMMSSLSIKEQLLYRHTRMLQSMLCCGNAAMAFMARRATMFTSGALGKNTAWLIKNYGMNCISEPQWLKELCHEKYILDSKTATTCDFIRELCAIRQNPQDMPLFNDSEIVAIINELCTG